MKNRLIISLLLYSVVIVGQPPGNDPNYEVSFEDFDPVHNYLNTSTWNTNFWPAGWGWGQETYDPNNVAVDPITGELTLTCNYEWQASNGLGYYSGGCHTGSPQSKSYSFGYFEIESQFPVSGNRGPWGGFWMHTGDHPVQCASAPPGYTNPVAWEEIDVVEPDGCDTESGTGFNCGSSATTVSHCHTWQTSDVQGLPDLSSQYYKYSLNWMPNHVEVFYEGGRVLDVRDPNKIPSHPMYLFLTFQVSSSSTHPGCDPQSQTPLWTSLEWKFKNLKHYTLKTDCLQGIYSNNFNFQTHNFKVQKYYSLGGSSIIQSTDNVYLHSTDYVEFRGGFEVAPGGSLTAKVYGACPN